MERVTLVIPEELVRRIDMEVVKRVAAGVRLNGKRRVTRQNVLREALERAFPGAGGAEQEE
ncbi:hypothetical protein [Zavarzinia sp. CC-PAN008]|uniref:hypothetical protein n=1 Tax=Zavarzinia sp. CC-PAN008 TaxID=3243332 RepID=UPI003F743784